MQFGMQQCSQGNKSIINVVKFDKHFVALLTSIRSKIKYYRKTKGNELKADFQNTSSFIYSYAIVKYVLFFNIINHSGVKTDLCPKNKNLSAFSYFFLVNNYNGLISYNDVMQFTPKLFFLSFVILIKYSILWTTKSRKTGV